LGPILSCSGFDFDVNARRQAQLVQCLDRLGGGGNDIDQALVRPDLKLLPSLFVDKGAGQNRVFFNPRWQRNRSVDFTVGPFDRFHNILRTLIEDRVIVGFHTDANDFVRPGRHGELPKLQVWEVSKRRQANPTELLLERPEGLWSTRNRRRPVLRSVCSYHFVRSGECIVVPRGGQRLFGFFFLSWPCRLFLLSSREVSGRIIVTSIAVMCPRCVGDFLTLVSMPRRTALSMLAFSALLILLPGRVGAQWAAPKGFAGTSGEFDTSREARDDAVSQLPLNRLTTGAQARIRRVVDAPTLFRRLPTQQIECDPEMFVFLVRHPEVMVGIWEIMGITKVQTSRTAPFQLQADDHAGTECEVDLVYGDHDTHLFYAAGEYSGPLAAVPVRGKGVFVLHSRYVRSADGRAVVIGTLDCFIQLDSLGADLVARTLSGLIGRTADNNFAETAKFISQISKASALNPQGMVDLASRLPQVQPGIRQRFAQQARTVHERTAQADGRELSQR